MEERIAHIQTPDGKMETFITHPEEAGPFPMVIVFMDIWGLREELFDIARRVGTVGYYCLVPDMFYRQGRLRFDTRAETGKMLSVGVVDPNLRDKAVQAGRKVSDAMVAMDTGAMLEFANGDEAVRRGAVGVIGYCMGGRHALFAAGFHPDRVRATACLHGTNLVTTQNDSPHLLADRMRGEIYCAFAEKDQFAAPSVRAKLEEVLASAPVTYHQQLHKGVDHGYALPDRDIYDRHAAARDWEIIFAMFRRQMPPGGT